MIPCPFCGADGDGLSVQVDRCVDTDESYAWVECGSCEASGPVAETLAEDLDNPEELATVFDRNGKPVKCRWMTDEDDQ